ncbi:MAG: (Fe-S)-binding protein [Bacteroidetes bacterium]|jgi:L-lactate dehydrogenase complex protein LldE|nr:(Fe-S)-binding protein [Bacteroidota bacterium]MBT6687869.1 (Fe-S)-binding protein [Bacteroidota bacterium]MBT7142483.1 (Fe-S)-binding protein [Bacteroidota bacterium]MBT7490010.1 (Fe-S)-binding protein [Bacteroidota bacterium]
MIVDLFIPCFVDQVYPETGFNVIKILKKLDIEVFYNPKQTCCGQPSFNSGYWKETKEIASKFLKDFPNDRPIVSPSGSCSAFVKNYYGELFSDDSSLEKFEILKNNMFELSDFLVNYLKVYDLGAVFPAKVTYHDACSALREYGLKEEARILLKNVKGLELIEMNESDVCCGFGGTFSVKHKSISTAMTQQKVENAMKTGAEYIVTTEASCILNIEAYIKKQKLPIKTIHIADILSSFEEEL